MGAPSLLELAPGIKAALQHPVVVFPVLLRETRGVHRCRLPLMFHLLTAN